MTHIDAPAEKVWDWMSDARNLLGVNLFHVDVEWDEPITEAGPRVPVPHQFGLVKQRRVAHIRDYRQNFIGFGETKAKEEPGADPFPHYQSFEVVPLSDDTCVVVNTLRGVYQFPGAQRFGKSIFHRWTPPVLVDDNANVAIAVGALDPADKPRLKGTLRMLPAAAHAARYVSRDKRRKMVDAAKKA